MWELSTLGSLTERQKRFFQWLTHCAFRFFKHKLLVCIKILHPQSMKKVQKVAQKPDAVQNNHFNAACLLIDTSGIISDRFVDNVSCNEYEVIDAVAAGDYLLESAIYIFFCNAPCLHLIAGYYFIIVY